MSEALLFDVARGSVADGPGLRTTFFLKGCPLRCSWCHNPESWSASPCPGTEYRDEAERRRYCGFRMGAAEALHLAARDRVFYERSGGGLTLSGGEPTAQGEFCAELLALARAEGIGTCMETSGHCDRELLLELAKNIDLFLFDLKATGEALHEELTGVGARPILDNLEALYASGAAVALRCPLVPGVNDSPGHLRHIARLVLDHPRLRVEILPYHDLGLAKYDRAGLPRPSLDTFVPDAACIASWLAALRAEGVEASLA